MNEGCLGKCLISLENKNRNRQKILLDKAKSIEYSCLSFTSDPGYTYNPITLQPAKGNVMPRFVVIDLMTSSDSLAKAFRKNKQVIKSTLIENSLDLEANEVQEFVLNQKRKRKETKEKEKRISIISNIYNNKIYNSFSVLLLRNKTKRTTGSRQLVNLTALDPDKACRKHVRIKQSLLTPSNPLPTKSNVHPLVSPSILYLINYWENKGLKKCSNPNTKVYKEMIKGLVSLTRGTFYEHKDVDPKYKQRKFNSKHFELAVDRFAKAAFDANYWPAKNKERLTKMYLTDFLYAPYARIDSKSWFLYYLENESQPILPDDLNHLTTESYIEVFRKVNPDYSPSVEEQRDLIKVADRTEQFFQLNIDRIENGRSRFRYPYKRAEIVVQAVEPKTTKDLLKPWVFTDILPKFLDRKGIWRSSSAGGLTVPLKKGL